MPEITIGANISNAEAGSQVGTLRKVSEPHLVTMPENSPFGGGDVWMMDWEWDLPNGETLRESTSTASGPKSKFFERIMALNNGRAPMVGEKINTDAFVGRSAILTIAIKESGWPKIVNVGAIPLALQQQAFAAATGLPPTGAPVSAPAPQPLHPAAAPAAVSPLRPTTERPDDDQIDF